MANSVDSDQSTLFASILCWAIICSRRLQQTTFSDVFFFFFFFFLLMALLSSANDLCKQLRPRSGPTERSDLYPNRLRLQRKLEKVYFGEKKPTDDNKKREKRPSMQRVS